MKTEINPRILRNVLCRRFFPSVGFRPWEMLRMWMRNYGIKIDAVGEAQWGYTFASANLFKIHFGFDPLERIKPYRLLVNRVRKCLIRIARLIKEAERKKDVSKEHKNRLARLRAQFGVQFTEAKYFFGNDLDNDQGHGFFFRGSKGSRLKLEAVQRKHDEERRRWEYENVKVRRFSDYAMFPGEENLPGMTQKEYDEWLESFRPF